MTIEAQRPASRRADLAPGQAPERRKRHGSLPEARREEPEIALRLGPGGIQETIPVTREILLNPSLDVQIVQNRSHDHKLRWLAGRLEPFLRARGLVVHSDVGLDWPGARTVSPDLSVIENVPASRPGEADSLSVRVTEGSPGGGQTGDCRVRTVFEVVSSGKEARWKDEVKNPPFFAQRGVEELVLLYLPRQREATDPPIRVFADPTPAGYATERNPDPEGFFELLSIGVRIGVESTADGGETVVVLDTRTGERLPDVDEALQRAAEEAEARRRAEQEKQQEAEARRQAEQEKLLAEQEKQQEAEARRQAEQEKQQTEQLNQKMAAEIERLRAQLRDAGST